MDTLKLFGHKVTNWFDLKQKSNNLEDDIISFIKLKEGGLTDNQNDSAAKRPVGVTYTHKGKTTDKWHTNQGITWGVFKDYASKLGYSGDANTFYNMPKDVWFKIYKELYYKPFANITISPLINYYISMWAWGSGVGGAKSLLSKIGQDLNAYIKKYGEKQTLLLLVKARIAFFERLVAQKPQNKGFLQGWINSAISFYKNFESYAKDNGVEVAPLTEGGKKKTNSGIGFIPFFVATIFAGVGAYLIINRKTLFK
jgi:hypothetical protein